MEVEIEEGFAWILIKQGRLRFWTIGQWHGIPDNQHWRICGAEGEVKPVIVGPPVTHRGWRGVKFECVG